LKAESCGDQHGVHQRLPAPSSRPEGREHLGIEAKLHRPLSRRRWWSPTANRLAGFAHAGLGEFLMLPPLARLTEWGFRTSPSQCFV
jgi:hypothetical protein